MRSQWIRLTLALCLSFGLFACSSKPTDTSSTATSSSDTSATSTSTPASGSSGSAAQAGNAMADKAKAAAPAATPAPQPTVVAAGTVLTVRLGQSIGSKISQTGETFSATLAEPISVDGKTVIPAGSTATGVVTDAKPLGRFKGAASLSVKLTGISINGTEHAIETSSIARSATGKGKRTAGMIGGGAGLGAVIGAIAGGGKGAAIGAIAGAGAGTAGTAFTGNKDIVLPAESALSFKLESPLQIK